MKVIIRCVLAIVAVIACITLISDNRIVLAQLCCNPNWCELPPPNCPNPGCNQYTNTCSFYWTCNSPISIDVEGKGFHLTDQAHGVSFQFSGNQKQQVAWTDPNYGNAWLALDRNGNGLIDNATELFGNDTPQLPSEFRTVFLLSPCTTCPRMEETTMVSSLRPTRSIQTCSCGRTQTTMEYRNRMNLRPLRKQVSRESRSTTTKTTEKISMGTCFVIEATTQ